MGTTSRPVRTRISSTKTKVNEGSNTAKKTRISTGSNRKQFNRKQSNRNQSLRKQIRLESEVAGLANTETTSNAEITLEEAPIRVEHIFRRTKPVRGNLFNVREPISVTAVTPKPRRKSNRNRITSTTSTTTINTEEGEAVIQ